MTDPKLPFVLGQEIHEAVEGLNELVRAATLSGLEVQFEQMDLNQIDGGSVPVLRTRVSMPIHPEER